MSKMNFHDPFEYLKHKLWPKEELRVIMPIWLPTIQSRELPWNMCEQVVCHISLERSWQRLQLRLKPDFNWRFSHKVMALQSSRSPNFESFGIPNLVVPKQNNTWMQPLWLIIENTIRGKVVASPKSELWWVLWVCVCPWLVRAPKVFQLCTNQLVVWFVQSLWIVDSLVTIPSPHSGAPTLLFYPQNVTREHTPILSSSIVFTFELAFEFFKEFAGASSLFLVKKNYM